MAESGCKKNLKISFKDQKNLFLSMLPKSTIPTNMTCQLSVNSLVKGFYDGPIVLRATFKTMEKSDKYGFNYVILHFTDILLDEIKVVAWNSLATHFFNLIEIHQVYKISKFFVNPSNLNRTRITYPFFIHLIDLSVAIKQLRPSQFPLKAVTYVSVSSICGQEERAILDVVGLVQSNALITNKYGEERQTIILIDESGGKLSVDVSKKLKYFEMNPVTPHKTILGLQGIRYISKLDCETEMMVDTIIKESPQCLLAIKIQIWMEGDPDQTMI